MADPLHLVGELLAPAFARVAGDRDGDIDPVVRPSEHADAQANGALPLAKRLGRNPRELAAEVVADARLDGVATLEVAGPGFVNVTFDDGFLSRQLTDVAADARLGVRSAPSPERVVVDYSAPNVAKEMHVGHLRSTVIGDSLVRLLQFVGHDVVRENHIGDWGTPFGMLIEHYLDGHADAYDAADPNGFYQAARARFDGDPEFADRARHRVVLLQHRDPATVQVWQQMVDASAAYFDAVYRTLGVLLTSDDLRGESVYDPLLTEARDRLDAAGLLQHSDGAAVVYPPGYTNRDGDPLPLIVQKRDGGFNYATFDLACVIDRVEHVGATRLVYVVGSPQAQHLAMVFQVAEMAGWLTPPAQAVHVGFGSVLGEDRKMLKTRSGDSVKLQDLLDEGVLRAGAAVAERSDLPAAERDAIARAVGIGAIKYADLSVDRVKDYTFEWERMLAFDGNTAPYLQYAHARICSVFRRAEVDRIAVRQVEPALGHPAERALALALLQFDGAVQAAVETYHPHKLCTYLFDLAQTFTAFYEACPVLRADEDVRTSRLALCDLTARVLEQGLDLLGIAAPERM